VTPDEAVQMFVDVAVEETAAVLAEDRHPDAARIVVRARARFERMDMTDAIVQVFLETTTDEEARALWREKVRRGIRRNIADLRPS